MMIHYNKKFKVAENSDRDSAGLDAGAVVDIMDPDMFFDELPQPFRSISKIIETLVSNACDQVDSAIKAQTRSMRLSKQQLADLTCLQQVEDGEEIVSSLTKLYPIGDSLIIFYSDKHKLVLWDSGEMVKLDDIDLGGGRVEKIDSFEVSPTRFLVIILTQEENISKMTIVGVSDLKLYVLTEQEITLQDSIAADCSISPKAEYLAVSHAGPDNVCCVEVYNLQSDAWFRNLESQLATAQNLMGSPSMSQQSPVGTEALHNIENIPVSASALTPNTVNTLQQPGFATESIGENEKSKIQSCQMVLRYKYPVLNNSNTLPQFIKASESGDGLCLGGNHILSPNFLNLRQMLHRHRQTQFMPVGIAEQLPHLLTVGNEPTSYRPPICTWLTNVKFAVAWPGLCSLVIYSAIKPPPQLQKGGQFLSGADQNEGKPESSWPLSAPVIATSCSRDLKLMAVLLEGGNIVAFHGGKFVPNPASQFSWPVSGTLHLTPAPVSVRKFSIIESNSIAVETLSIDPSTSPNFASLISHDDSAVLPMRIKWKFNSHDIGNEFAFVEIFEQWPSVAFIGLPDGALLLCERGSYSTRLAHLKLPTGYVWPMGENLSDSRPTLSLTADGRILFGLAHFEALITSSVEDSSNKMFRFDLASNLPSHLISRWKPMATKRAVQPFDQLQLNQISIHPTITTIANSVVKQIVASSSETSDFLKKLWTQERDQNKDSRN